MTNERNNSMGSFFSNVHIRKNNKMSLPEVENALSDIVLKKGYRRVDNKSESDIALYIYNADSSWISVSSDIIEFPTEEAIQAFCVPLSDVFETDVLAISCHDSDFLFLNLINRKDNTNAWAKTGKCMDSSFRKKSAPTAWKNKVTDVDSFRIALKTSYVFAEESLQRIEPLLQMSPGQGMFCPDIIPDMNRAEISTLYFALPEYEKSEDTSCLDIYHFSLMPCEIGKSTIVTVISKGGSSKGIAIAFSGNYVEKDEITFRDTQLEYGFDKHPRKTLPLNFEKRLTTTGQWIYYAELNEFNIPAKVKEDLPVMKAMDEELKKSFGIRFTPEGNPRKRLDICVHFISLKNTSAQCSWCVWYLDGTKLAYINNHNKRWSNGKASLLDSIDFDDVF